MNDIRYAEMLELNIRFMIVSFVSIIFVVISVLHEFNSSDNANEKRDKSSPEAKSMISGKGKIYSLFGRIFHFSCIFSFCFILSALLIAYSGYWDYFGIKSFLTLLPIDKYFPSYVYIIISITSLFGAILLFGSSKRSVLYERLAWWFFPTGILCSLLGGTGLTRRMPGDNGMGDGIMVIGSLPLFLEFFLLAYVATGIISWLFGFFRHR